MTEATRTWPDVDTAAEWWDGYSAYLRSPAWRAKRITWLAWGIPPLCARCGADWNNTSQLHHLTYERVGDESLDDLMPLCSGCHQLITDRWRAQPAARKARLGGLRGFSERHAPYWRALRRDFFGLPGEAQAWVAACKRAGAILPPPDTAAVRAARRRADAARRKLAAGRPLETLLADERGRWRVQAARLARSGRKGSFAAVEKPVPREPRPVGRRAAPWDEHSRPGGRGQLRTDNGRA